MLTQLLFMLLDKNQRLVIGDKRTDGDYIEIYELKDGSKVYSNFDDIEYINRTKQRYSLSDALKMKKTTIESIIFKRDEWSSFNDGGTKMYNFYAKNKFVNKDIAIYRCHSIARMDDNEKSTFTTDIYIVNGYIPGGTPCSYSSSKWTALANLDEH